VSGAIAWDATDIPLGERAVASLNPGTVSIATTSLVIPSGTPPGKYNILALTDDDHTVAETFETNNLRPRVLTVN
jgi:subtilase family serine protease